jgi:serine/threonine-protein kinase RsbW
MGQAAFTEDGAIAVAAIGTNVPEVRRRTVERARALGAGECACRRIALAVSEAATNAVMHAFGDRPGTVVTRVEQVDDGVEVVVSDDGTGLQPRGDSPGLGMGLGIIADMSDRLVIDARPGRGTEVRMWFSG